MEKSREFVKDYMSQPRFDASHDYDHIQRVLALSFELLRVEQKVFKGIVFDATIIELVALFHDVDDRKYRPPADMPVPYPSPPSNLDPQIQQIPTIVVPDSSIQDQPTPNPFNANTDEHHNITSDESKIENDLLQLGWPNDVASKVAAITPFVSYTAEVTNKPGFVSALSQYPELAIVLDADRLDAIGAVGIARAFTYGGAKDREGGMAGTIHHFTEKLSKIEVMMKTGEGKRMAVARAERLRIFGRWWQAEMKMVGMANESGMEWIQDVSPWANPDPSTSNPAPPQSIEQRPSDQASQAALRSRPEGMDDWQRPVSQDVGQNLGHNQQEATTHNETAGQQQSAQHTPQQTTTNRESIQREPDNNDPSRQLIEAIRGTVS